MEENQFTRKNRSQNILKCILFVVQTIQRKKAFF